MTPLLVLALALSAGNPGDVEWGKFTWGTPLEAVRAAAERAWVDLEVGPEDAAHLTAARFRRPELVAGTAAVEMQFFAGRLAALVVTPEFRKGAGEKEKMRWYAETKRRMTQIHGPPATSSEPHVKPGSIARTRVVFESAWSRPDVFVTLEARGEATGLSMSLQMYDPSAMQAVANAIAHSIRRGTR